MATRTVRLDREAERALAEIRKTTAANGGTPLGRSRFQTETGIREHDWTRYWARWSEAVRDADVDDGAVSLFETGFKLVVIAAEVSFCAFGCLPIEG